MRVLIQTTTYPLMSEMIIVTQTVREISAAAIATTTATANLTTFGSADASITVRSTRPTTPPLTMPKTDADLVPG